MADKNILRTLTLNGKTFTVPDGGGGGDGYSFVAVNNSGTISAEIDIDELISACEDYKEVRAILKSESESSEYVPLPLMQYYSSEELTQLEFSLVSCDNAGVGYQTLTVNITNGKTEFSYEDGYHPLKE